jgi:nitrate/TMAO reductase-like tetraheme cytochrome c subunit
VTRLRIFLLAILVVVALGVAFAGYRAYSYVEHDPDFCASCHLMAAAWHTWKEGPHKNVNCKVCHEQNIQDRARIVWRWATSDIKNVPPHTKLARRVCEECHLNDKSNWPQIRKTAGHEIHVARDNLECLACHLPSLHATKPTTKECTTCHSKASMNIGGMKAFHCTTCHRFTAPDKGDGLTPVKETCMACHVGMSLKGETFPAQGPMHYECSACHKPHSRPLLTFADCLGCHAPIAEDRRHFEQQALTKCVTCHKPHGWKAVTTRMTKKVD